MKGLFRKLRVRVIVVITRYYGGVCQLVSALGVADLGHRDSMNEFGTTTLGIRTKRLVYARILHLA